VHYLRQSVLKATTRSALQDARAWFEQALGVLAALPENQSTLEQAFDIRFELRSVLHQLGEVRRALEHVREAESFAERLHDDRRLGRVCAFTTVAHAHLGELDEALASGTRGLEIAGVLGDLDLRILTTTLLEQAHYYRGEYERVIERAIGNLAAIPSDRVYDQFGNFAPASLFDRLWLVWSLTELGRFTQAAEYEAEMARLAEAEPTHRATLVGMPHFAAGILHLRKGDWAKARLRLERVLRPETIILVLAIAVPCSAWALAELGEAREAMSRLREGEELLERLAARGHVSNLGWAYGFLGRTCLLLGQLNEARRLGDRAVEFSPCHPGFAAHALHLLGDIATHPDRFDAESGEAYYRQALALAEPSGMRPLVAHCHLGLGNLSQQMGRREQAQEHLATSTSMYREIDMRFWLQKAKAEMH
jgi:tetratricopeptide (TPR) repeat protein